MREIHNKYHKNKAATNTLNIKPNIAIFTLMKNVLNIIIKGQRLSD